MRIVGGKDYYDHGLAYGLDESVVFLRTGRVVLSGDWAQRGFRYSGGAPSLKPTTKYPGLLAPRRWVNIEGFQRWSHHSLEYRMESVYVVFCGHFYSGARVHWEMGADCRLQPGETPEQLRGAETFWDSNSLGKWLAPRGMTLTSTTRGRSGLLRQEEYNSSQKPFARYPLQGTELELILAEGVAVATLDKNESQRVACRGDSSRYDLNYVWQVNSDTLKDYQFIKVMDPVRAFQELSMWIGGVLPKPGNPVVTITDDAVKLAKHGMDARSFRSPPGKKRGRQ